MIIGFEAQRIFRSHKHGMDFVALELIRALQRLDDQNKYIVFTNEGPDKDCLQESENLKIVTFTASFPVWEQILLPKQARKHGCDILHCTSNTAPMYVKTPTVITLHDIIYLESNPLFAKGYTRYQRFGNFYRRMVVSYNLSRVSKIVTVSNFEKQRLIDFLGLAPSRVDVVYNGVGAHFFKECDDQLLSQVKANYNLPDRYVLFLGNTDPKKNTRNTILAFARYVVESGDDIHLVVADLNESLIKGILEEEGLESVMKKIHDTGYINNKDLPAVLQQAELFLYPSKRESFGIPIVEAMASNVPVITSDAASMPEVSGGRAYLVDPNDVDSIKTAIHTLLKDDEKRREMALKGKERALDFSWESSAKQMLDIYKSIIE